MKDVKEQQLITRSGRNTAVHKVRDRHTQVIYYDMPDLVLYLRVAMVSLGEVSAVSEGWSVVTWLSREF